jgi:hypothetical protein
MLRSFNNMLSCNALQGGVPQSGIVQEGGKENVDPAPSPRHPRTRSSKKVSSIRCCAEGFLRAQTALPRLIWWVSTLNSLSSLP